MKAAKHNFYGQKLKQARLIRSYTIQQLSEEIGVTHQSISKYEKDQMTPTPEILELISRTLQFEKTFFYSEPVKDEFYDSNFIYRKKSGVAKKYQMQIVEKMSLVQSFVDYLEKRAKLRAFKVELMVDYNLREIDNYPQLSNDKIIDIATNTRRILGLGDGPLDNVTLLCEKLGVIVVYADLSKDVIDGCSVFYKGRPYIMLNSQNDFSAVRQRFTIAHELGHILLHSKIPRRILNNSSNSSLMEKEANFFASCLLMPEKEFVNDVNGLGLDYLLILKKHWKVSVAAMIFRAESLGIFNADYALYLRQQLSRKGWRKSEPLDNELPKEKPILMHQVINYLLEKKALSLSEISFHTGITENEIMELFYVNVQNMNHRTKNNSGLRRIK